MSWAWFVGVLAAGLPGVDGARRLLRAARAESAGERETARREVRSGGLRVFCGSWLLLGLVAAALVAGEAPPSGTLLIAGAALLVSGAAGLLGGLSGKPRPSGDVALALYCLGWLLATWALLPGVRI